MKKKTLAPMAAILLVIILACAYYLTPKTFGKNVDPSDVDHIQVFDGNTGQGFTIDDPEDIQYIVENIQSRPMKRAGISLGRLGYRFKISYMDEKEKTVVPAFILNGDSAIRKDPFFYTCDGGLCFDDLKNLESKYSADLPDSGSD